MEAKLKRKLDFNDVSVTKRLKVTNNDWMETLSDDTNPSLDIGDHTPHSQEIWTNNKNNNRFPMIFDWSQLTEAITPAQLRTEALKKQERGKYVRRDSLSQEEAADRRRRQNRESAKRTRERVRKYITCLEMYYSYAQNTNALLIKQLEVIARFCNGEKITNLKMHPWPKPPTIQECIEAKPANIGAVNSVDLPSLPPPATPQQPQQQTLYLNPLQPFEEELELCGISLNNHQSQTHTNNNRNAPQIATLPNGQLLVSQTIQNNNNNINHNTFFHLG